MKRLLLSAIFGILIASALPGHAQVYKWVDEKGNVQYGDRPPASATAKAETVTARPVPESSRATMSWQDRELDFQRRKAENSAREPKEPAAPTSAQICANARYKLNRMDGTAIYRVNKNGERVFMEDSERAAIEKKAKEDIALHCRN